MHFALRLMIRRSMIWAKERLNCYRVGYSSTLRLFYGNMAHFRATRKLVIGIRVRTNASDIDLQKVL